MKKSYVFAILSDVHIGAFKAEKLYSELEMFLTKISSLAILDAVIITGDLFDCKISMNSDHAIYAFKFFSKLREICKEKNSKLRIIKGTESHDNNQLSVLEIVDVLSKECDCKIIEYVDTEELFEDLKVLYLPEEYMSDMQEFYKEFFENEYDLIFGHGMVNEVMFVASQQESEMTMSKAPIFSTKDLLKICKGPIFFGHIHTSKTLYDRFFYTGSFSRWSFGEEEDKGFYIMSYSPSNHGFTTEFIINDSALTFDTMTIDEKSVFFSYKIEDQIKFLTDMVDTLPSNKIRIKITIPEDYENSGLLSNLINDTFSKYTNVKVVIYNSNIERQKKEVEDKVNILLDRYGFIFDRSVSHEEKISKFLKIKYGKNMDVDTLREYLYQKTITK